MDDKNGSAVNKRINTNPAGCESPCKAAKIDNQSVRTPGSEKLQNPHQEFSSLSLTQSIDSKMSNIAKLRQQFVEEVKSVELSQMETIKSLKQNIAEANQKLGILTMKLKEANEFSCNQSEIIYQKEEENKVLREKVAELFGYQKILYENMEAISDILCTNENLANHLENEYDHVMLTQDNDIATLEEKLRKLNPDTKLLTEVDELNLKINELDREIIEYEGKSTRLETELKEIKMDKGNEQKKIEELDRIIIELEAKKNSMIETASQEKSKLSIDIQKLDFEIDSQVSKQKELEQQIGEFKLKVEMNKEKELKVTKQIEEANSILNTLLLESENLDKTKTQNEQENNKKLEKLKEELQSKQIQLGDLKKNHSLAINILQNKISELQNKIKCYDGVESKFQKIDTEVLKEEELLLNAIKNGDEKRKELTDKIKSITGKIDDNKLKLIKIRRDITEAEGKIRALEKEIRENNEKYDAKLKASEKKAEKLLPSQNFNQGELPFMSEDMGKAEKEKNRKKLYTPTFTDNDLDIDKLTLEEQVTHLTQVPTSSPEMARKFFKRATMSQSKAKRESTPRGKGRGKKH